MKKSKLSKKLDKSHQILRTVKSYEYLLYGIIAHIYILFLICLSTELELIERDLILNYAAMISLVVLILSRSLKWTWPIFIEETLIVILLWILMSNFLGAFQSLCTQQQQQQQQQVEGIEYSHNDSMIMTVENMHHFCNLDLFNIIYSFICILLVLSSFLLDFKHYIVSFFFRFIGFLCLLLIIFLPSSCNRFQWIHPNELIIKITLYNIVWYYNSKKRNIEAALFSLYKLSTLGTEHTLTDAGYKYSSSSSPLMRGRRHHVVNEETRDVTNPSILFNRIQNIGHFIEEYIQPDLRIVKDQLLDEKKSLLQKQVNVFMDLNHLNQEYYHNTYLFYILSWKNQSYTKQLLYIIDIARSVWILIICPFYLPLVLLELIWIAWYIRQNGIELKKLRGITKVFYIYKETKGDFSAYI